MVSRFRFLLLPIFGAVAALAAFKIAAPFEGSLNRPGFSLTNPETQFTYGTQWGDVNRAAFGALLCGLFCFGLTLGRRAWYQVAASTLLGAALGGLVNYVTDSGSDLIGLTIARRAGMLGNIAASAAWCILVPLGISLVLLVALGPTAQRVRRAAVGTVWAAIASAAAQMAGTLFATKQIAGAIAGNSITLASFIPAWRAQEIAVGVALGLAMAYADVKVRAGTLRLMLGRNERREWSLDYAVHRVGSAEGIEIPLGSIKGVEKIHALIVRQGDRFMLDTQGRGALVNGVPMTVRDLVHGDSIQLGDAKLEFLAGDTAIAASYPRSSPAASSAPTGMPLAVSPGYPPAPAMSPPMSAPMSAPVGVIVDAAGGQYHLPPGQYGVGREQDNAICLSRETSVSRHHAQILITPQAVLLSDAGSTNGTFVNGVPIACQTALRPGDRLRFGDAHFTVDRVPGGMP